MQFRDTTDKAYFAVSEHHSDARHIARVRLAGAAAVLLRVGQHSDARHIARVTLAV